jgi:hypothetical protein
MVVLTSTNECGEIIEGMLEYGEIIEGCHNPVRIQDLCL